MRSAAAPATVLPEMDRIFSLFRRITPLGWGTSVNCRALPMAHAGAAGGPAAQASSDPRRPQFSIEMCANGRTLVAPVPRQAASLGKV